MAGENTQLPFEPATIYRNDTAVTTTGLQPYDVYYYSQNARTLWVYSRKAAGRITAVTPSASAPRHRHGGRHRIHPGHCGGRRPDLLP